MKDIKAFIFDLDGTLIDTEKIYRKVWPIAARDLGYNMTEEHYLSLRSLGRPYAPLKFKEWFGEDFDYVEARRIRKGYFDEYVAEPLGIILDKSRKAIDLLKMLPIASAEVIGIYGHTLADRLNTLYRQKINQSYVTGSSFEELEDMYEARFNTFERGLQTEGETIGESLGTQYERIVFSKNAKQIKGYVWQSILDGRTCVVCGSLSGMKFTDLSKVPIYLYKLTLVFF